MKTWGILLSGGVGSRLSELHIPKQYYKVDDKPIIAYTWDHLSASTKIDQIVIVAAPEWREMIREYLQNRREKLYGFCQPGTSRQSSIYSALQYLHEIADEDDVVIVHDAVRPFASSELIDKCINTIPQYDGAMPVIPTKDTLYESHDGRLAEKSLKRDRIFAGQAPEAFLFGKYLRSNEVISEEEMAEIRGSSEPALRAGMTIRMVDGEESNFKITTKHDIIQFQRIMRSIREAKE
jgi:2-C-methyl-D-erythritol 4-phosphate cytidylyltransferase